MATTLKKTSAAPHRQSKADAERYGTLDRKIKRAWVKALRSRKYKQGREYLRDGNEYCCLGVLCDISGRGSWDPRPYQTGYVFRLENGALGLGSVPSELKMAFGLSDGAEVALITANDDDHWGFGRIATWIEKHL
jgi:hypothetical protein